MSRSIWVICLLVAAVAGFALGRLDPAGYRRSQVMLDPAGPDLQAPIRVARWDGGGTPDSRFATRYELVPYRVMDGSTCVFDRPDRRESGGDAWWIELADGRVIIFAQSRSAE